MIKFTSLFSGSSGNSYFLQVDSSKFLIDVGVSKSKIVEELTQIGEDIKNIDAILITHEHIDHIRGLSIINKNYDIPIYINKKTLDVVNERLKGLKENSINLFENKEFFIDNIKIQPFNVSHDAADPVGFSFYDKNKKKATIATDLGEITEEVYNNVSNSDLLILEANYDDKLIRYSPYPMNVISRIISPNGHLPNSESLNLITRLIEEGLKNIALAHISRSNNNFEIVSQLFTEKINSDIDRKNQINLEILRNDKHSNTIIIE